MGGRLTILQFGAMKKAVLKPRSTVRGSVGEVGIRCSLPVQKLVLKERPIARGTAGLLGVRRAVLGGEPGNPMTEDDKSVRPSASGDSAVITVSCTSKKVAEKNSKWAKSQWV